jgi:hypothetical protein
MLACNTLHEVAAQTNSLLIPLFIKAPKGNHHCAVLKFGGLDQ